MEIEFKSLHPGAQELRFLFKIKNHSLGKKWFDHFTKSFQSGSRIYTKQNTLSSPPMEIADQLARFIQSAAQLLTHLDPPPQPNKAHELLKLKLLTRPKVFGQFVDFVI
jgi:hypothetical protein